MNLPFAEKMPYWKTSKSGLATWLDRTEKIIAEAGGEVDTRIAGKSNGREAIMFGFSMDGHKFKILWPVLPTKKEQDRAAAMRQAATMIYHDTKSRAVRIGIFTAPVVFSDWLLDQNGKTIAELGTSGIPGVLKMLSN